MFFLFFFCYMDEHQTNKINNEKKARVILWTGELIDSA